jgi:hypothetical protein
LTTISGALYTSSGGIHVAGEAQHAVSGSGNHDRMAIFGYLDSNYEFTHLYRMYPSTSTTTLRYGPLATDLTEHDNDYVILTYAYDLSSYNRLEVIAIDEDTPSTVLYKYLLLCVVTIGDVDGGSFISRVYDSTNDLHYVFFSSDNFSIVKFSATRTTLTYISQWYEPYDRDTHTKKAVIYGDWIYYLIGGPNFRVSGYSGSKLNRIPLDFTI